MIRVAPEPRFIVRCAKLHFIAALTLSLFMRSGRWAQRFSASDEGLRRAFRARRIGLGWDRGFFAAQNGMGLAARVPAGVSLAERRRLRRLAAWEEFDWTGRFGNLANLSHPNRRGRWARRTRLSNYNSGIPPTLSNSATSPTRSVREIARILPDLSRSWASGSSQIGRRAA